MEDNVIADEQEWLNLSLNRRLQKYPTSTLYKFIEIFADDEDAEFIAQVARDIVEERKKQLH